MTFSNFIDLFVASVLQANLLVEDASKAGRALRENPPFKTSSNLPELSLFLKHVLAKRRVKFAFL